MIKVIVTGSVYHNKTRYREGAMLELTEQQYLDLQGEVVTVEQYQAEQAAKQRQAAVEQEAKAQKEQAKKGANK